MKRKVLYCDTLHVNTIVEPVQFVHLAYCVYCNVIMLHNGIKKTITLMSHLCVRALFTKILEM